MREIKAMGCRTVLLTGDRKEIGDAIAKELGVDEVDSELLPEEKVECVRDLRLAGQESCRWSAMASTTLRRCSKRMWAVAMGSGTDVARESASVVLLGNDLLRFAEVLKVARRCRNIIMANFAGTLAVDSVGVALAAMGFLNPVWAALIHVSSELLFIRIPRVCCLIDSDAGSGLTHAYLGRLSTVIALHRLGRGVASVRPSSAFARFRKSWTRSARTAYCSRLRRRFCSR